MAVVLVGWWVMEGGGGLRGGGNKAGDPVRILFINVSLQARPMQYLYLLRPAPLQSAPVFKALALQGDFASPKNPP